MFRASVDQSPVDPTPSKHVKNILGENLSCLDLIGGNEAKKLQVISHIKKTGLPYKEIEVIINNTRMILRMQKLPVEEQQSDWEPICDCSALPDQISEENVLDPPTAFLEFPMAPDPPEKAKNSTRAKFQATTSSISSEEPNVFLLKIRRRSERWDKRKEFIDLEFTTPKPWEPRPVQNKPKKIIDPLIIQERQSEIAEEIVLKPELFKIDKKLKKKKKKRNRRKKK